jgi:hypothetical protein
MSQLTVFQDIGMMARLIQVPHFVTEESYVQETNDRLDIARAKKLDDDGRSVRMIQIAAVRRMQTYFFGSILRRTTDSLDWEGKVLINIPPYVDVIGVLDLTQRETDILHQRQEAVKARLVNLHRPLAVVLAHTSFQCYFGQ